jgi:hypothetical protein
MHLKPKLRALHLQLERGTWLDMGGEQLLDGIHVAVLTTHSTNGHATAVEKNIFNSL